MLLCFWWNPNPEFPSSVHLRTGFLQTRTYSVEVKCRRTMMAASSITSSVMIFFTSSLEAPRSYLHGILKNDSWRKNDSVPCFSGVRGGSRSLWVRWWSYIYTEYVIQQCCIMYIRHVHAYIYIYTLYIRTSHTDYTTKLKFCRTHDQVDRKSDPPRPVMTWWRVCWSNSPAIIG